MFEKAGRVQFDGARPGMKIVKSLVTFGVIDVPLLKVTINYAQLGIERPNGSVIQQPAPTSKKCEVVKLILMLVTRYTLESAGVILMLVILPGDIFEL